MENPLMQASLETTVTVDCAVPKFKDRSNSHAPHTALQKHNVWIRRPKQQMFPSMTFKTYVQLWSDPKNQTTKRAFIRLESSVCSRTGQEETTLSWQEYTHKAWKTMHNKDLHSQPSQCQLINWKEISKNDQRTIPITNPYALCNIPQNRPPQTLLL